MSVLEKDLPIDIVWDSATVDEWRQHFLKIDKSNIIQAAPYAYAMRDVKQQITKFGVILLKGEVVGILQIQEIKLFGILHLIFLHRGPLWFEDISTNIIESFFKKLNSLFPRRFGRVRRIMPELEDNIQNREMLLKCGFKRKSKGYRSIWIDLSKSLDDIRKQLSSKWRNSLNKSIKANLVISELPILGGLDILLCRYMKDRLQKKYRGASPKMIKSIVKHSDNISYPILLNISKNGEDIAMGLFLVHGNAATYQIGWSNECGRKNNANNFMLWKAIEMLKDKGIKYLDLGGINDETAAGVTKFKRSMGGENYSLVGIYS